MLRDEPMTEPVRERWEDSTLIQAKCTAISSVADVIVRSSTFVVIMFCVFGNTRWVAPYSYVRSQVSDGDRGSTGEEDSSLSRCPSEISQRATTWCIQLTGRNMAKCCVARSPLELPLHLGKFLWFGRTAIGGSGWTGELELLNAICSQLR